MRIAPFILSLALFSAIGNAQSQTRAGEDGPNFPKTFDRPTVTRMIKGIDQGTNFPILKVGYFLNHSHPVFPVAEGLALLKEEAKKEKAGSKRWVLMNWLRAFGTLRTGEEGRYRALRLYDKVFDESLQSTKIAAPDVVRRVIDDFVSNVPGPYLAVSESQTEDIEATLQKALLVHFHMGSRLEMDDDDIRPHLFDAIAQVAHDRRTYERLVQTAEKDARVPKTFGFYFSAEQVVRAANTGREVEPFQKALTLLALAAPLAPDANWKTKVESESKEVQSQLAEAEKAAADEAKARQNRENQTPKSDAPAPK